MAQAAGVTASGPFLLPPFTKKLFLWSFAVGIIPPIAFVLALAPKSLYFLDYVHVICGGSWTGFDLYTGLVLSRILRSLEVPARVEVAKRLTPTTFFIIRSLAAVAITSVIYLAQAEGKFNLNDPWILAAGLVVIILTAQGFGVFLPNGVRIFLELAKARPDAGLISKLTMRNVRLAASQAAFQLVIILIMAHLAIYQAIDLNLGALVATAAFAGALLLVFGLLYRMAAASHARGELGYEGIRLLRWALVGQLAIFGTLALTAFLT